MNDTVSSAITRDEQLEGILGSLQEENGWILRESLPPLYPVKNGGAGPEKRSNSTFLRAEIYESREVASSS